MNLKSLKHNLSFLFLVLTLAGCGKIDDVRNSAGNCTNEFKVAYNELDAEFMKLQGLTVKAERVAQVKKIDERCEVFFEAFAEGVECNATRDNQEVSVESSDYKTLCSFPEHFVGRIDLPGTLD